MRNLWLAIAMAKKSKQLTHAIVKGIIHQYGTTIGVAGAMLCSATLVSIEMAGGWRVLWNAEAFDKIMASERCPACDRTADLAKWGDIGVSDTTLWRFP